MELVVQTLARALPNTRPQAKGPVCTDVTVQNLLRRESLWPALAAGAEIKTPPPASP